MNNERKSNVKVCCKANVLNGNVFCFEGKKYFKISFAKPKMQQNLCSYVDCDILIVNSPFDIILDVILYLRCKTTQMSNMFQ